MNMCTIVYSNGINISGCTYFCQAVYLDLYKVGKCLCLFLSYRHLFFLYSSFPSFGLIFLLPDFCRFCFFISHFRNFFCRNKLVFLVDTIISIPQDCFVCFERIYQFVIISESDVSGSLRTLSFHLPHSV